MSFQPYPTRSGFIFLGVTFLFIIVAAFLTRSLLQQNDPPAIFNLLVGLLIVLGIIGATLHWTLVAFKLGYHLNRNGLAIQWGLGQQLIPFNLIQTIIPGKDITMPAKFRGANIAGLRVGRGELPGYGLLKFRATAPLADSLLIITPQQAYVISPNQPQAFLRAWHMRQPLGATQQWYEGVRRRWPFNIALLTDPLTWWLLTIAAFFCFALLGYLSLNYPDLPASLPIHYNNLGQADRIADKMTLFTLPAAGGIVWAVNLLLGSFFYQQEKLAAYLLWSSTVVMQFCLWVAVLTITAG
jgi:hypothetical protein